MSVGRAGWAGRAPQGPCAWCGVCVSTAGIDRYVKKMRKGRLWIWGALEVRKRVGRAGSRQHRARTTWGTPGWPALQLRSLLARCWCAGCPQGCSRAYKAGHAVFAAFCVHLHTPRRAGKNWGYTKQQMRLQTHLTFAFGDTKSPLVVQYLLSVWCSREPQFALDLEPEVRRCLSLR